jgi:hypothetical protein
MKYSIIVEDLIVPSLIMHPSGYNRILCNKGNKGYTVYMAVRRKFPSNWELLFCHYEPIHTQLTVLPFYFSICLPEHFSQCMLLVKRKILDINRLMRLAIVCQLACTPMHHNFAFTLSTRWFSRQGKSYFKFITSVSWHSLRVRESTMSVLLL